MRMAAETFAPLDRAIRDNPTIPNCAWAFVNFGKFNFAIADYTQALHIDPNDAKAYIASGSVPRSERVRPRHRGL
jgi:tetratricopeptide (TPR) repeat protein